MDFTRIKKKYWIYGLVAVVTVSIFLIYQAKKDDFIKNKVTKTVTEKTDSLYKVSYDSIYIDEAAGDVFLYNLRLLGDTALQKKYLADGDTSAAPILLDVFVPVLKVEGFGTLKALLAKKLTCKSITITKPRITVYIYPEAKNNNDVRQQGQALYKKILGDFKLIQADSISINNANIIALQKPSEAVQFQTLNTGVFFKDVLIDSAHYADTNRTLFSRQLAVQTDRLLIGNEKEGLKFTRLKYSTVDKLLAIAEVENSKNNTELKGQGIVVSDLLVRGPLQALDVEVGTARIVNSSVTLGRSKGKKQEKASPSIGGIVHSFVMRKFKADKVEVETSTSSRIAARQFELSNLALDSATVLDAGFFNRPGSAVVRNGTLTFRSKDNMYDYVLTGLLINPAGKSISLKEFAVKPLLGEEAFARRAGTQRDRFNVQLRNIKAEKLDFVKLAEGEIDMASISASNNSIKIYRDISRPLDSIKKVGNYPHQLLFKSEKAIRIDKVDLSSCYISYKERNGLSDTSGNLYFENSSIKLSNVTNRPSATNNKMNMNVSLNMLGKIPLNVDIRFYLDKVKQGQYYVKANGSKPFSGSTLNQVTMPMGLLKIEKGTINSLSFEFMADNINAQGDLTVTYKDLKISLLKKKDEEKDFDKKGILSFLANIVVKNDNPGNGKVRTAHVVYKRDEYKSFFNMIWKFAFNGLKDVMGAKL